MDANDEVFLREVVRQELAPVKAELDGIQRELKAVSAMMQTVITLAMGRAALDSRNGHGG